MIQNMCGVCECCSAIIPGFGGLLVRFIFKWRIIFLSLDLRRFQPLFLWLPGNAGAGADFVYWILQWGPAYAPQGPKGRNPSGQVLLSGGGMTLIHNFFLQFECF